MQPHQNFDDTTSLFMVDVSGDEIPVHITGKEKVDVMVFMDTLHPLSTS